MADVMVSPRVPGPWHRQKEIPVVRELISAHLPLNLKRPFPFDEGCRGNWKSIFESSTPRHSKRHLTTRREPMQLSRERSEMSHSSLSINHLAITRDNLCCPLEHIDPSRTYADFMNTAVMKRTASSDSYPSQGITHGSLDHIYARPITTNPDNYDGFVSYAHWAKTPSFASGNEESPSGSSSFDSTDIGKYESSVFNGPSYSTAGIFTEKPPSFQSPSLQFGDPRTESEHAAQWLPWPTSEAELSSQPYFPDNLLEAQSWASAPPVPQFDDFDCILPATAATIPGTNPLLDNSPPPQDDHTIPTPTAPPQDQLTTPIFPQPTPTSIPQSQTQTPSPSSSEAIKPNIHYTDSRNALLIDWKRRGLSYKDIKRIGGFKEAESTLRGRFRTLTKTKEQRVRKPKWTERDVSFPTPCHYHVNFNYMAFYANLSWKRRRLILMNAGPISLRSGYHLLGSITRFE